MSKQNIFYTLLLGLLYSTSFVYADDSKKPFKIGGIAALTGPASNWGNNAVKGWELAVEELNQSGGLSGRPIQLVVEDSKTSGNGSVSAFHKLKSVDNVDAMVGDVWDFITTPLIPLADSAKLVLVSTIIDQSTHRRSPYFFTLGPKIKSTKQALARFFALNPQVKKFAILGWENDWGYAYEKVWNESGELAGAKNVSTQRSVDFAALWKTEMARLRPLGPDLILFGFQGDRILRRANELKMKPAFLTTSNVLEDLLTKSIPSELSQGVFFTDWRSSDAFVKAFKDKFNAAPILNAADGYESIRSIAEAYRHNPQDLDAGMKQVKYTGVNGPIDFRVSNDGNLSTAGLFKIVNGEIEKVE